MIGGGEWRWWQIRAVTRITTIRSIPSSFLLAEYSSPCHPTNSVQALKDDTLDIVIHYTHIMSLPNWTILHSKNILKIACIYMSIRSNKCLKKYCSLIYNYKNTCTPTKISDKRTTCIGLYIQVKLIMKELKRVNYLCHLISNLNHTCNVNIFTSK